MPRPRLRLKHQGENDRPTTIWQHAPTMIETNNEIEILVIELRKRPGSRTIGCGGQTMNRNEAARQPKTIPGSQCCCLAIEPKNTSEGIKIAKN